MKEFKIAAIKALYYKANMAVLLNNQVVECFGTSIGLRQRCILSSVLFFKCIPGVYHDENARRLYKMSINGRPISNLRFVDDIHLIGENVKQVKALTSRLDAAAKFVGMEISAVKKKSKMLTSG